MTTEGQRYCQRYPEYEDVEVLVYHRPHVEQWVGTSHQGKWIHANDVGPSVTYKCRTCGHTGRMNVAPEWRPPAR
jgi:hypothetical protein